MSEKPAILVVDDNDMLRKLLVVELSAGGRFRVDSAATGAEGIEKAIASGCSVIVLDMMLPDTDGLSFIEKIKIARPKDLPSIIAITAAPTTLVPDAMIEAPNRGLVSAIFRKPFDHAKLRETVVFCAED